MRLSCYCCGPFCFCKRVNGSKKKKKNLHTCSKGGREWERAASTPWRLSGILFFVFCCKNRQQQRRLDWNLIGFLIHAFGRTAVWPHPTIFSRGKFPLSRSLTEDTPGPCPCPVSLIPVPGRKSSIASWSQQLLPAWIFCAPTTKQNKTDLPVFCDETRKKNTKESTKNKILKRGLPKNRISLVSYVRGR